MDSTSGVVIILIVIVIVYFLPSIVAAGRERNGGVLVLNLFLGWTLVGWSLRWPGPLLSRTKPRVPRTRSDLRASSLLPRGRFAAHSAQKTSSLKRLSANTAAGTCQSARCKPP
jgi:hypothetical protein